jgi:predicted nucleotidyltransferase
MSQKEVITLIKEYILLLKQMGIPVEKAYLYGSYARNEATATSDIDLLLISDLFDTRDDYILSSPWKYTTKIDHRIEPIAVGSKKFQTDYVSPIIQIVRKEGIEIVL